MKHGRVNTFKPLTWKLPSYSLSIIIERSLPVTSVFPPPQLSCMAAKLMQAILMPRELECLMRARHKPGYVVGMIDQVVATSESYARGELACGDNLAFFTFAIGSSERIFKTPIPLSWTSEIPEGRPGSVLQGGLHALGRAYWLVAASQGRYFRACQHCKMSSLCLWNKVAIVAGRVGGGSSIRLVRDEALAATTERKCGI
jgi:hypothetical protein